MTVGNIQMLLNNEWWTLCYDPRTEAGVVACRQLGFSGLQDLTLDHNNM